MQPEDRSGRGDDHAETPQEAQQVAGTMPAEAPGMGREAADHEEMMRSLRERMLWTYFANLSLGLWLVFAPFTFGYHDDALVWSDVVSGVLVLALGLLALYPAGDFWGRWGICFTGIWLLFAPLVLWAPDAASYANDTIVGSLLIAFSVLAPMMPGRAHHMAMMAPGPDVPPRWRYNPSTFYQRGPIIALGVVSFFIARYMAAFQLEHIGAAWDPFFRDGTEAVLLSDVSRAWPISDAGLGAVAYGLEALSGFMGGRTRWRTMPWMVLMFGFLVIPLGITSITLVILQPVMVGTWCTLCLVTAGFMLLMIPLAVDEVVAMIQFMVDIRREGQPLWRTFWAGGTYQRYREGRSDREGQEYTCPMHPDVREAGPGRCSRCGMELVPANRQEEGRDTRSPRWDRLSPDKVPAMVWGVTLPWNLVAAAVLGLWLMAAPEVLGVAIQAGAADSNHVVGALIAVVAVMAWAEVVRSVRYLNVLLGAWVTAAALFLPGATTALVLSNIIVGVAIVALSLPRGSVRERYGTWGRYVV